MRIIGHIDHPSMKITVFKMDNRLSVKFESGLYEQTYKFRSGEGLDQLEDIRHLVDEAFTAAVLAEFERMHQLRMRATARQSPSSESSEFEEII